MSGLVQYLFNALSHPDIRRLFGFADGGGHHLFPRSLAVKYSEYLSDDAVDYASRQKIGAGYTSRGLEGDPHNGYNAAHIQNNAALDTALDKYIRANNITPENPMTPRQVADFLNQASKLEAVRAYNDAIGQFMQEQSRQGVRPNLNRVIRGSGQGGKSGDGF